MKRKKKKQKQKEYSNSGMIDKYFYFSESLHARPDNYWSLIEWFARVPNGNS